jgi:hypothetical protein
VELNRDLERAQLVYARWLNAGTRIGLVLLIAGFLAYVLGLLPPHVPLDRLPQLWGLPLKQFVEAADAPTGWEWLALAARGDYLNLIGVALLASIVAIGYLRILPMLARGERVYALIALLQIVVLAIAASGYAIDW